MSNRRGKLEGRQEAAPNKSSVRGIRHIYVASVIKCTCYYITVVAMEPFDGVHAHHSNCDVIFRLVTRGIC